MQTAAQERLLAFIMGKRGLAITCLLYTSRESLLVKVLILFYFYTATAVHEAGALAPANAHGAAPWSLLTKVYLSFWIYTATAAYSQALQCLRMGMA